MTPERLAIIRRLAREGDPYFQGYVAALEPSPEPVGVSSSQRKDTP